MILSDLILLDHWTDDDLRRHQPEVCDLVRNGRKAILTLGITGTSFLLITTDMFVFEIPIEQLNPRILPPFKVLIDREPSHFRKRWPQSYATIAALSGRLLYAFIVSNLETGSTIVFAYANEKSNICLKTLDMSGDKVYQGMCQNDLPIFRLLSCAPTPLYSLIMVTNDIDGSTRSTATPSSSSSSYLSSESVRVCFEMTFFTLKKFDLSAEEEDPSDFATFMKVQPFHEMTTFMRLSTLGVATSLLAQKCRNLSAPIVNGFAYKVEQTYVIDSADSVMQLNEENSPIETTRQPLSQFIGCNEPLPIDLKLNVKTILIGSILVVIQLVICYVCIQSICANWRQSGEINDDDLDLKRKSTKSGKKSASPRSKLESLPPRSIGASSKNKSLSSRRRPPSLSSKSKISSKKLSKLSSRRGGGSSSASKCKDSSMLQTGENSCRKSKLSRLSSISSRRKRSISKKRQANLDRKSSMASSVFSSGASKSSKRGSSRRSSSNLNSMSTKKMINTISDDKNSN